MNEVSITEARNELREMVATHRTATANRKHALALTLRSRAGALRKRAHAVEIFWYILMCASFVRDDETFVSIIGRAVEGPGCCPTPDPFIHEGIDAMLCHNCGKDM